MRAIPMVLATTGATLLGLAAGALSPARAEPAAPLVQAFGEMGLHIVQPGESLFTVTVRYGMRVGDLARMNATRVEAPLLPGRGLWLPMERVRAALADAATAPAADGLGGTGLGDDGAIPPGPDVGVSARIAGAAGDKRIEVDIGEQRMYVWQGDALVWDFVASTGMSGYPTRRGTFEVQSKIANAWSSAWQLWMPDWLGIYWAGGSENGIHALPIIDGQQLWAGYLGTPISYGCIVLDTPDAELLYAWAEIGTKVEIHD